MGQDDRVNYSPKSQHRKDFYEKPQESYVMNEMARKHHNEHKSQDLSRHNDVSRQVENFRSHRSRLENEHSRYNQSITNYNEYENEKMRQEFYTLKSDNILYKEEVNLLHEKNQKLEEDLARQHNRK